MGRNSVFIPELISGAVLDAMEIPPTKWLVQDVIPEGLGLIIGKPKGGKSWLGINFAVDVAKGNLFLGRLETEPSGVIYLCLEDSLSRIQQRARGAAQGTIPGNIHFALEWGRFDQISLGLETLEKQLDAIPDCRLVIIDVWQMIRGRKKSGADDYEADYGDLAPLRNLALSRGLSLMLIHHSRKEISEEEVDNVLGSTAIAGCADFIVSISKVQQTSQGKQGQITVRGRDLEEDFGAVCLLADCRWSYVRTIVEDKRSTTENSLLAVLTNDGQSLTKISEISDVKYTTAQSAMARLVKAGLAVKEGACYRKREL
jgi:hypothetical protein